MLQFFSIFVMQFDKKRHNLWPGQNWVLHHDNAPAHRSLMVSEFLTKHKVLVLPSHHVLQILRLAGSNPAGVDGFFQSVKILIMASYRREVKPWVTCHRFTSSQN